MAFTKNHIPWNKDLKGIHLSPKSEFKKGQTSWNKGKAVYGICQNCGKESYWIKKGRVCRSCRFKIKELHPRWKGGISRTYKTGYYSNEYKQWRIAVFTRDGFTCRDCGAMERYLTAHHIKSFAHYPELRFEVSNGLTLCEDCHKKTDNYKGRAIKKRI